MNDEYINGCPFGYGGCTYIPELCNPNDEQDKERCGRGYSCTAAGNEIKQSELLFNEKYPNDIFRAKLDLSDGECSCEMGISEYACWNHKCAYGCGGNLCIPVKKGENLK